MPNIYECVFFESRGLEMGGDFLHPSFFLRKGRMVEGVWIRAVSYPSLALLGGKKLRVLLSRRHLVSLCIYNPPRGPLYFYTAAFFENKRDKNKHKTKDINKKYKYSYTRTHDILTGVINFLIKINFHYKGIYRLGKEIHLKIIIIIFIFSLSEVRCGRRGKGCSHLV